MEQGGVVIRSNGVVDSAATINGAKEMGEAMLDTFGEEAVLALKGRHGCNGLEILLDGLNFLGRKLDFECIGANGHSEASETVPTDVCDVGREVMMSVEVSSTQRRTVDHRLVGSDLGLE